MKALSSPDTRSPGPSSARASGSGAGEPPQPLLDPLGFEALHLKAADVTSDDHPLSLDAASRWNTYFQACVGATTWVMTEQTGIKGHLA
jgi:hypothetical protein